MNKKNENSLWFISAVVLLVLLIVSLLTDGFQSKKQIDEKEAEEKVSQFLKDTLGKDVQITDIKEEKGLYYIGVSLDGQNFNSYLTKDGSLFFPSVILLDRIDTRDINRTA